MHSHIARCIQICVNCLRICLHYQQANGEKGWQTKAGIIFL